MNAQDWLTVLALGGFLGASGQAARVVVGLKKQRDAAAVNGRNFSDCFDGGKLLVSLLIGAVAGILAMLGLQTPEFVTASIPNSAVLAIITAGYAGADFIEGFIERQVPGPAMPRSADSAATPQAYG